ncbi:kinase/pyrophosphorylase [Siculibacillus lacustris]|uniref:Putative pyruvate, phosphate dikinase regulatory protein n=1 Tax=Siculibacillus lacustris TaxID=1549641 RepID=A0A4Q9VK85_9HYPH|nr:pyruvate, water dikinase regulatory protein [Siculibacillus lacustris]TBW35799.1 kinase/pyrophosphorylase [Siculibacillus lacustris]
MKTSSNFFHLHLISDSTGETLITVARAAAAQYEAIEPIEHVHPLVRTDRHLDKALVEIEQFPGIVLYTLVSADLATRLERFCLEQGLPCVSVLAPVLDIFQSFLNLTQTHRAGAQHALDADYFKRIEAMNFTMAHDDGQLPADLDEADIVVLGISRTSKTPTSIYLANRGLKVANVPIVLDIPPPPTLFSVSRPLVVGLVASPDRIAHIRENRILTLGSKSFDHAYVDRASIAAELTLMRRICTDNEWPVIDVSRRSIEETAAAIIALLRTRRHG